MNIYTEAIEVLITGINNRDNVADALLDLEAIISLAGSLKDELEKATQIYDETLEKNVSLHMVLDGIVAMESHEYFNDRPQACAGMTDAEARLFIVKDLSSFLDKHNYEMEEGGF